MNLKTGLKARLKLSEKFIFPTAPGPMPQLASDGLWPPPVPPRRGPCSIHGGQSDLCCLTGQSTHKPGGHGLYAPGLGKFTGQLPMASGTNTRASTLITATRRRQARVAVEGEWTGAQRCLFRWGGQETGLSEEMFGPGGESEGQGAWSPEQVCR